MGYWDYHRDPFPPFSTKSQGVIAERGFIVLIDLFAFLVVSSAKRASLHNHRANREISSDRNHPDNLL